MKKILLVLVGLVVCSGFAAEDASEVTQRLLKETMDRGIEILKDASLDDDHKMTTFQGLLRERCHTELMAKLVLGKSGWTSLSEEQRPEFISAFIQMMTRSYYTKMSMADLSTVEISYAENEEISAKKRVLKAFIKDETDIYHLEYKFALIDDHWGIYDLVIEGISLLASYRSEYSDYLKQHSGAELIELLEQKVAEVSE